MKKLKKMSFGLAVGIATLGATSFVNEAKATCDPNDYMGSVCWFPGNFCPDDYLYANGGLLSIGQYSTLYSVIGTNYGGDGRTTFGLPDLRGRTAVGLGLGPGIYHNFASGTMMGTEYIHMSSADVAPHSHSASQVTANVSGTLNAVADPGDQTSPEGAYPAARPSVGKAAQKSPIYTASAASSKMAADALTVSSGSFGTVTTSVTGVTGPQPIPIRPPQQAFMPCVNVYGLYPPRP